MESIGLAIRRAVAFAVDLFILGAVVIGPSVLVLVLGISGIEFSRWGSSALLLAGVLSYFTVFEVLWRGQTPGKRLLSICVRATRSDTLIVCRICGRICSIIMLQLVLLLFADFFTSTGVLQNSREDLIHLFWITGVLIWPVSVIVGRGRFGLHDYWWGTEVTLSAAGDECTARTISRPYPWICVLGSVALAVSSHYLLFAQVENRLREVIEPLTREQQLEIRRLMAGAQDLPLWVENGPQFCSGEFSCRLLEYYEGTSNQNPMKLSFLPLPQDVREGRMPLKWHAQFEIPVTQRGIASSTFQVRTAHRLFGEAVRPGLFVTVDYINAQHFSVVELVRRRRLAGFLWRDLSRDDSQYQLFVIEPDHPSLVEVKLRLSW